jgi:Ca-activated chloride channel homolog
MLFRRRIPSAFRWLLFSLSVSVLYSQALIEPRHHANAKAPSPPPDIRVDTTLVLIPVSVTDRLNHPVTQLAKNNFRVFEGPVEHEVLHLTIEDSPMAVAIVFDTSGSMQRKLPAAREALAAFLKTANPEDEFALVEFGDKARLTCHLTGEPGDISERLTFAEAKGQTALLDAVGIGIAELKKSSKPRKAMVVVSDGGDNRSRYTEREIRGLVRESEVPIYSMGIFESGSAAKLSAEELAGPALLKDLANDSGGRAFNVTSLKELSATAERIGVELHNSYVLGYAPSNLARDGKYHRVHVKLVPPEDAPELRVEWRSGYYAPQNE